MFNAARCATSLATVLERRQTVTDLTAVEQRVTIPRVYPELSCSQDMK